MGAARRATQASREGQPAATAGHQRGLGGARPTHPGSQIRRPEPRAHSRDTADSEPGAARPPLRGYRPRRGHLLRQTRGTERPQVSGAGGGGLGSPALGEPALHENRALRGCRGRCVRCPRRAAAVSCVRRTRQTCSASWVPNAACDPQRFHKIREAFSLYRQICLCFGDETKIQTLKKNSAN